ncbi:hypothetical protein [Mesorhizobium silamurunense]|uniref:hypothetical protein n=1 Tax=Mesorhizobium silamurunense TaxID=499528 RepID=UPI001786B851|nr:hypothetical protein [Mesorhizobium silamurunense]
MTKDQHTILGVDVGSREESVAAIVYPDGRMRLLSRDRFDLVVAEAAADRFDDLGKPMVDFYKP